MGSGGKESLGRSGPSCRWKAPAWGRPTPGGEILWGPCLNKRRFEGGRLTTKGGRGRMGFVRQQEKWFRQRKTDHYCCEARCTRGGAVGVNDSLTSGGRGASEVFGLRAKKRGGWKVVRRRGERGKDPFRATESN